RPRRRTPGRDADVTAHGDVEEPRPVARLRHAEQVLGARGRLPRRGEHGALGGHGQLHADGQRSRWDDAHRLGHRPFRMRTVLWIGSWSERGMTSRPKSVTDWRAISWGCVDASTPKMSWSQPMSAYR